jgi:hypothetical protein
VRNETAFLQSVHRLLVTASVVPSSPIVVNLMKEALSSSETSRLPRAARRNIPAATILHRHRRENLKSYVRLEVFTTVTMKNGVFCGVTPCSSCKNRLFGGT